jgi:hypothetical protein
VADSLTPSVSAPAPLPDLRLVRRALALAALVAALALLAVADRLSPDASGMGTHRQLGLPACGWVDGFGLPCATCGMTTAFAAAADGDLAAAFRAQPFGALLALATGVTAVVSAFVLLTGSAVGGLVFRFLTPRTAAVLGVLAVLAWIYKIAAVRLA